MKRSVLAMVNGHPWDMHRPLEEDCEIEFLHMLDENCDLQNKVYQAPRLKNFFRADLN